ncbi:MAG: hypothetical protein V3571_15055 [Pseudodesulfovibrio sp.]
MNAMEDREDRGSAFMHRDGVTYFSKRTERRILFVMTMVMLLWGVVEYARDIF